MEMLFLVVLLGLLPAYIAKNKGREFVPWWIYGALILIVALPHALLLKPDRRKLDEIAIEEGDLRKCPYCAELIRREAKLCHFCGKELTVAVGVVPKNTGSAIWNPNAAANWSLIFTPAFGAYLQMLNWKSLGETAKADASETWFYVSLVMLVVYALMGEFIADSKAANGAVRGLGLFFLLVWYFLSGRAQGKYVKEKFGKNYPKKLWGKPLLIGVGAIICYFIVAVLIGLVLGGDRA